MGKVELKIELDSTLVERARAAGIDVAKVTAAALERAMPSDDPEARARRWAEENAEAIRSQEERIERIGIIGEDLRTW